jgi:hypothetical protein
MASILPPHPAFRRTERARQRPGALVLDALVLDALGLDALGLDALVLDAPGPGRFPSVVRTLASRSDVERRRLGLLVLHLLQATTDL